MNIYLYDSTVKDKVSEKILIRIETRLTDLGLNGKIIRLGMAQSITETIENEIKKGATTIVVVGSNYLFCQALNSLAKLEFLNEKKIPLGFIPIGVKSEIINFLGLDYEEEACNILAARRIEKFNLSQANNNYFLTQATISTIGTRLEVDNSFTIEFMEKGEIIINNLCKHKEDQIGTKILDNHLGLLVKNKNRHRLLPVSKDDDSFFYFKILRIYNKNQNLILDNSLEIKTPSVVCAAKEKINLIVGKTRKI
jgi:hypothetical protein